MTAKQGHKYLFEGVEVIAMESGRIVHVREIVSGDVWRQLGKRKLAPASMLTPLPMKYFGGQVPA